MKEVRCFSYGKAGTMRRSGAGILFEIPGGRYYLTSEDISVLFGNQSVSIIDGAGEAWGCAWLSPVRDGKKKDMVVNIRGRTYVISLREIRQLLAGRVHLVPLLEYVMKGDPGQCLQEKRPKYETRRSSPKEIDIPELHSGSVIPW